MAKSFDYGCPVCGEAHPKMNHRCTEEDLRRYEKRLRNKQSEMEREPKREFDDKLEEFELLTGLVESC